MHSSHGGNSGHSWTAVREARCTADTSPAPPSDGGGWEDEDTGCPACTESYILVPRCFPVPGSADKLLSSLGKGPLNHYIFPFSTSRQLFQVRLTLCSTSLSKLEPSANPTNPPFTMYPQLSTLVQTTILSHLDHCSHILPGLPASAPQFILHKQPEDLFECRLGYVTQSSQVVPSHSEKKPSVPQDPA